MLQSNKWYNVLKVKYHKLLIVSLCYYNLISCLIKNSKKIETLRPNLFCDMVIDLPLSNSHYNANTMVSICFA